MSPLKIILLVVGILAGLGLLVGGGLALVAYLMMDEMVEEARDDRVAMDLKTFEVALASYERNNRYELPTEAQGLRALVERPTSDPQPERWRPFLADESALLDPWGNPYQYANPARRSGGKFDLWSLGEDGVESEDDIGNW